MLKSYIEINNNFDWNTQINLGYSVVIADCTNNNININLPNLNSSCFRVIRTDNSLNTLTLTPYEGQTISGGASTTLTTSQYCDMSLINNDWFCLKISYGK